MREETRLKSINVGSGIQHFAEINVDLNAPCDIICDAHFLPFQDNSFRTCYLHHVIEHVENPVKVLDECVRVSRILELRVPHGLHPYSHIDASHIHFFKSSWFQTYAKKRKLGFSGILRWDPTRSFYYLGIEILCHFWKS